MNELEVLKEYFKNSPKKNQGFILSPGFNDNLQKIAQDFDLRPSKTADLKNEILFVLVGLEDRKDFQENLLENLDLPKELTLKISNFIEKNIFEEFTNELTEISETLERQGEGLTEIDQTPSNQAPTNLPVGNGQKIPTFSDEKSAQIQIPKKNINILGKKEETVKQGLSQEDIFIARPQTKPVLPPTRAYRDEKIGGVNVEKETEEIEENIDRAELLKDIENPVKSTPAGGFVERSQYKGSDPYREPTE